MYPAGGGLGKVAAAVAALQGGRCLGARPGAEDGGALCAEARHGGVAVPPGGVPGWGWVVRGVPRERACIHSSTFVMPQNLFGNTGETLG